MSSTDNDGAAIIRALHGFIVRQADRISHKVEPDQLRLAVHPATYARLAMVGSGDAALMRYSPVVVQPWTIFGIPTLRDPAVAEGDVVFRYEDRITLPAREPAEVIGDGRQ